jgi:hypothetical protein
MWQVLKLCSRLTLLWRSLHHCATLPPLVPLQDSQPCCWQSRRAELRPNLRRGALCCSASKGKSHGLGVYS